MSWPVAKTFITVRLKVGDIPSERELQSHVTYVNPQGPRYVISRQL